MTATSQHKFHPDAESLNAFAEQALSERERSDVLAHLALCGRCRQVVALAQQAEAEVENEQLVAAAAPGSRLAAAAAVSARNSPGAWWRRWRLVWIPAAVTAAFAVTAVPVYLHQKEQSNEAVRNEKQVAPLETRSAPAEMAKVTPPLLPKQQPRAAEHPAKSAIPRDFAAPPQEPAPQPQMSVNNGPVQGALPIAGVFGGPGKQAPAPLPAVAPPPPPALAPPPPSATESVTVAQDQNAPKTTSATPAASETALEPALAPRLYKTGPAASTPMLKAEEQKKAADEKRQMEAVTAENRDLAAGIAKPGPVYQAAAEAPAPAVSSSQQVTVNAAAFSSVGTAGALHGASNGRPVRLPSGLEVVSFASANGSLLAIDTAGTVFRSVDRGHTWQQVLPQWTGRAVLVRTTPEKNKAIAPAAAEEVDGKQAAQAGGTASPTQFFEIVNDKNQVWQSTDGIVWKAK